MRILVADDHDLFRSGLRFALKDGFPDCTVVEARDLDEALDRLAADPSITLATFDLSMPGMQDGVSLRAIRRLHPRLRLVVVSGREGRETILAALDAGAHGFVPKSLDARAMVAAIEQVLGGAIFVPPRLAELDPVATDIDEQEVFTVAGRGEKGERKGMPDLTPRQQAVLERLLAGRSTKEIGRDLDLAEGTVKIHLAAIFRSLGARNRTDAVFKATSLGLARPSPDR